MDLSESAEQQRFRAGVRDWLRQRLPPDWRPDRPHPKASDMDFRRRWTAALDAAGLTGITWPTRYGGRGLPLSFQAAFLEECAKVGAPEPLGIVGLDVVGPTLLAHGTEHQRQALLPGILTGDVVFCVGLSEPEAGSDLAAVRARAVPDGDHLVVTGHKLWSSYAHHASHCLLLVRTGAQPERHRGLTCLVVETATPGVTVRPLRQLTGEPGFSEILLDRVRVPATAVVGRPGEGWPVVMTGLACERGVLGITLAARLEAQLRLLAVTARETGRANDAWVRDRIGGLAAEVAGLRWTGYRALAAASQPAGADPTASIVKLRWSSAYQRLTALALELLGAAAPVAGPDAFWDGYWLRQHLRSLGSTIEGGTSEIQRGVIAERLLGLPRSR